LWFRGEHELVVGAQILLERLRAAKSRKTLIEELNTFDEQKDQRDSIGTNLEALTEARVEPCQHASGKLLYIALAQLLLELSTAVEQLAPHGALAVLFD
jgi:hypothetical protein